MSDRCTVLWRLLSGIEDILPRPFSESELISFTFEKEKELLISLSQISILIRRSTDELRQNSSQISDIRGSDSHSGDHEFLTDIVAILVSLLNAKSQYVCHMVGNIFFVISEFLLAYGGSWDKLIHLLCLCFELAIFSILRSLPQSLITESDDSTSVASNMKVFWNYSTWSGIAEITRILRGVVKHLKGTDDDELLGVLLIPLSNCLAKVPWNLLNEIHNDCSVEVGGSSGEAAAKILFIGNLVQLLCSVVGLIGTAIGGAGAHHKSAILRETCDLVPRLLVWCHVKEWSHVLPYFEHKILMLMIRLSFHMELGCSVVILWLQLLNEFYQDLLSSPISQLECGQNYSLEGSPLLLSLNNLEVHHLSSRHLQRKAVFLFLRCSFSLIRLRNNTDFKCTSTRLNLSFKSELDTIKYLSSGKKELLKFNEWLQGLVPSNTFSGNEINMDECIIFASSFIRFYMQEDDMLFEVLLQMFAMPSWAERLFSKQGRAFHDTDEDMLYQLSNLFNPLLLFHVFLAELQYDHQLLLDYLISKDMGEKCAEYLLRCLRIISDSWKIFVDYSVRENFVCRSSYHMGCKRRKASHDDSSAERMDNPMQSRIALSFVQRKVEFNLRSKFCRMRCLKFEGAKACLLSLKSALRKLHRRKLFPYNPEVLLRRLTRFEELCDQLD